MHIDDATRVVLLPKEGTHFKVVRMPIAHDISRLKPYLVCGSQIYELNEMAKTAWSNAPQTKKGDFVRSLIVEGVEGSQGAVLQSLHMILSSKFNLMYILISTMHTAEQFHHRFASLEDIMDQIPGDWIQHLPEEIVAKHMASICEVKVEGGEGFYRFSLNKAVDQVREKCTRLAEHLTQSKNSLYLKAKQSVIENDVCDPEILDLAVKSTAVEFVCGSYTLPSFKDEVMKAYDFSRLKEHREKIKENTKNLRVVEANMMDLASKPKKVTKKVVKKTVKKVAPGKGALDGFFKKA